MTDLSVIEGINILIFSLYVQEFLKGALLVRYCLNYITLYVCCMMTLNYCIKLLVKQTEALQSELVNLEEWSSKWKLKFNAKITVLHLDKKN